MFAVMAIYFHLARVMDDRQISGYALAQRTGLTPSAIYKLRKQAKLKGFKSDTLDALCAALECQPGELLEYRKR